MGCTFVQTCLSQPASNLAGIETRSGMLHILYNTPQE